MIMVQIIKLTDIRTNIAQFQSHSTLFQPAYTAQPLFKAGQYLLGLFFFLSNWSS